ncbi:nucleotidyl transferase AbiEii/AbiGii toxin family protein [Clostridium tagluense]|uniref:nucleotidyl transferase AbiEii/AbiGii toxin family protein n=1 Tax=Clostridium tagluense TaxID=360422 RepID=UPI001C6EC659|nr:nucleotidyl transferase AbiEii/AbiGii toxin family protein [Clostridium tagluense]MBW9158036.1 nucleotidyl transferase AbiEii/AbiGii toxin family protein [Clostridium tagluense]WLC66464.1 nucleotidyl transferase AbiEii/AbiGii toxin family protein [Clostridium tagluense]
MQERILYRLSISKYCEQFILKGGLLIFMLTEYKGRPTNNIDFLAEQISNDIENIRKVFSEICNVQCEDDGLVLMEGSCRML